MKRRILSVVSGSLVALLIIAGTEAVTPFFFELPKHTGMDDKAGMTMLINSMPLNAFLMILGGYVFAAFFGGLVAALVATENKCAAAARVGMVLVLGGIVNFISIPHPRWFVIASLAVYIPAAYAGGLIGNRFRGTKIV